MIVLCCELTAFEPKAHCQNLEEVGSHMGLNYCLRKLGLKYEVHLWLKLLPWIVPGDKQKAMQVFHT